MAKLSVAALVELLIRKRSLKRAEAERFVDTIFDIIKEGLEEDKIVRIKGLGTFKIIGVDARESVNVNTGERVIIDSHSKITFTPDNTMKELVNKPFSQFETVVLNEGVDFSDAETTEESPVVEEKVEEKAVEESPIVEEKVEEKVVEETLVAQENDETDEIDESPVIQIVEDPDEESSSESPSVQFSESTDDSSVDENFDEESNVQSHLLRNILCGAAVVLLIVGAAYGGYRYGRAEAEQEQHRYSVIAEAAKSAEQAKQQAGEAPEDTLAEVPIDAAEIGTLKAEEKAEEKTDATARQSAAPKAEPSTPELDKYEQMDVRVRTGAYRITGTAQTIKIKAGQTLKGISRTYLGEGMECYMEVYNGIKSTDPLKAGDEIKIPKLELKRKK